MISESLLRDVMGAVLGVDPESIDPDSSMDTIEGWGSLQHMNLILALEDAFSVRIPDEDAANITSFELIKIVLDSLTGDH